MLRLTKLWLAPMLIVSLLAQTRIAVAKPAAYQKEIIVGLAVRNNTNVAVSFSLRNLEGKWIEVNLGAGANKTYRGYDRIWIFTRDNYTVLYKLEEEGRYSIYWNPERRLFDVSKQPPRR